MNMTKMLRACLLAATPMVLANCVEVKAYQKTKLNDAEMALSARKIERTETSFHTYREGASGANGGKAGGGCGCN